MCSSSLTTLEEWAVTQHYQTKTHRGKAVESSQTGAIAKHVEQASHSHTAAVLAAFQHVYFIAKQELPNSLYTELRKFSQSQGNTAFKSLDDSRASYTSNQFLEQAMIAISDELRSDLRALCRCVASS